VSASVNLPLHHKVQKFSSGTSSPGWSRKKDRKTVVVWCGGVYAYDGQQLPLTWPCPDTCECTCSPTWQSSAGTWGTACDGRASQCSARSAGRRAPSLHCTERRCRGTTCTASPSPAAAATQHHSRLTVPQLVSCNLGYVSPRSCWPKSAAGDRQRCASYAAVVPDSPLPAAVNKRYRLIYGHNWEHNNTQKRLAAVLLGTAIDEIAFVDIMERHKMIKLITSSSMTEIMTSFMTINSTTASPKTTQLLLAATASGCAAADCQYAQR